MLRESSTRSAVCEPSRRPRKSTAAKQKPTPSASALSFASIHPDNFRLRNWPVLTLFARVSDCEKVPDYLHQTFDATLFLKLLYNRFRYEFLRLKIDVQMKVFHPLACSGADGHDPRAADLTSVIVKLEEDFEKCFDAVRTGENDPVVNMRVLY